MKCECGRSCRKGNTKCWMCRSMPGRADHDEIYDVQEWHE